MPGTPTTVLEKGGKARAGAGDSAGPGPLKGVPSTSIGKAGRDLESSRRTSWIHTVSARFHGLVSYGDRVGHESGGVSRVPVLR